MKSRSDWNIIFGPPGTGKTTACMNHIANLLQDDVDPIRIGYIAFTKKAANEARMRAARDFNFHKDLNYVTRLVCVKNGTQRLDGRK